MAALSTSSVFVKYLERLETGDAQQDHFSRWRCSRPWHHVARSRDNGCLRDTRLAMFLLDKSVEPSKKKEHHALHSGVRPRADAARAILEVALAASGSSDARTEPRMSQRQIACARCIDD
ncbi:MAG: hypothetical protein ISS15_06865 [Alphaproteobacteria bacterium]|nr:hypothetical protein [Alphaproteobacteria bacterium]MBL7097359.1 hypothetical protein [Alphaproteobacteria bacterium]